MHVWMYMCVYVHEWIYEWMKLSDEYDVFGKIIVPEGQISYSLHF